MARKLKGLSQKALGARIDTPDTTISNWETGQASNPTLETLRSLSGALGVSLDWLVHGPQADQFTTEELDAGHESGGEAGEKSG